MRKLDSLTPAEIKEAVAALAPALGEFASYNVVHDVAAHLGSSTTDDGAFATSGYARSRDLDRYFGRVKRAMDLLAADGTLVKVAAGEPLQDRAYATGRQARYYTAEAYAAAKAEGDKDKARREEERARWMRIADRAAAGGYEFNRTSYGMRADHWEALLERAGL